MKNPAFVAMGRLVPFALALALPLAPPLVRAADPEADPHAHHHHMMAAPADVQRSEMQVAVPAVQLVRQDGAKVAFAAELNDGRPVYLNFIYTTCTTICPLSSQVFSQLQRKLGDDAGKVHLVSVSIDPEQDTPVRLREYAQRFKAGAAWQHYTGTLEASVAVQKAFSAYRGDKMNHTPLTLYRAAPGKPWVRLDGFATADQLLAERAPASHDDGAAVADEHAAHHHH